MNTHRTIEKFDIDHNQLERHEPDLRIEKQNIYKINNIVDDKKKVNFKIKIEI